MCFVKIAQLEHKRHNFGINLGAVPLGSRSGAVREPFGSRSGAVREPFGSRSGAVREPFGSRACGFRRFVFGENDFGNTIR